MEINSKKMEKERKCSVCGCVICQKGNHHLHRAK